MKTNPFVSSQARKVRKSFFNATKEAKHVAMSAPLSKELRETHGIKHLPIRLEDEVQVVRGKFRSRVGRVTAVKLRSMRINVESVSVTKLSGSTAFIPLHPSNVVVTKLKMDKSRKELIEKKRVAREAIKAKLAGKA